MDESHAVFRESRKQANVNREIDPELESVRKRAVYSRTSSISVEGFPCASRKLEFRNPDVM